MQQASNTFIPIACLFSCETWLKPLSKIKMDLLSFSINTQELAYQKVFSWNEWDMQGDFQHQNACPHVLVPHLQIQGITQNH